MKYPISKFKDNIWYFIKDFEGTLDEAYKEIERLQKQDLEYSYRIWDDREDDN